jgi:2-hydroxychromene-2-carboxylate isomerase
MEDWACLRDITINWPKIFPINSVKAMRGAFYFLDDDSNLEKYLEKVFEAYWTLGYDISSDACLSKIVEDLSVETNKFLEFIVKPETKSKLIENTQELMDRGGFGSPTFFLNEDDMYFGNDRIQLIEEQL